MYDFATPLKGLFNSSKRLVLDFTKIGPTTPDNENFEKIFHEYDVKNLNPGTQKVDSV